MSKVSFDVEPRASALAPFRKRLRPLIESAGFDSKSTHDILLSVNEVLTNIIRHGQSEKIQVLFSNLKDHVEILIEDGSPCFDPRTLPAPELPPRKPGGLGIHLVRSLADEIHYEALKPQGNRLRLVKYKNGKERNRKP